VNSTQLRGFHTNSEAAYKYEQHHNVHYTPDAIRAAVLLAERYISERFLPDKAIDVLDEAGARVRLNSIKVPTT
jgi:ATPases with chaperone activity, ATP-binding subunit